MKVETCESDLSVELSPSYAAAEVTDESASRATTPTTDQSNKQTRAPERIPTRGATLHASESR